MEPVIISPLDEAAMDDARRRQAQLAKPPGSLGRLLYPLWLWNFLWDAPARKAAFLPSEP